MKTYITLFILLFSFTFTDAQSNFNKSNIEVSIDWTDSQNKNHKYSETFQKKDEDYIYWVYETSKKVNEITSAGEESKKYYHDGRGNNPINFTVLENGISRIETYKNVVKPSERRIGSSSVYIPEYEKPRIKGKLPEGVMTYFSDSSKGYEMGIKIDKENRKVKIEILTTEKELIQIIEDETLSDGWHNYKLDTSHIDPDVYILKYTVDDTEMTQIINIDHRRGSFLGRLFDWLF